MIRSKILLLSNKVHFYALLATLIALTFTSLYYLLVLILYLIYLKHIRLFNKYIVLLIFIFTVVLFFLLTYRVTLSDSYEGVIEEVSIKDDYTSYIIKYNFRKILVYSSDNLFKVGDVVLIKGEETTIGYSSYDLYLKSKHIYSLFQASEIKLIDHQNTLLSLRDNILSFYQNNLDDVSFSFLGNLIFANKGFDDDFTSALNSIGLSHLFAISGYHITMLIIFLEWTLAKNIKLYQKRQLIIVPFLIFYTFLCANAYGVMRSVLMYILSQVNFKKQYNLSHLDICCLSYLLIMFINPLAIYSLSFKLTFLVTIFLILGKSLINDKNKLKSSFKMTLLAFFSTIPLVSNLKYELNLITILISPLFVLIFSVLIMPVTYLLVIFPHLSTLVSPFYQLFINLVYFFDTISFFKFSIANFNPMFIIIYYILLFFIFIKLELKQIKIFHYLSLAIFLIIMMNLPAFSTNDEVYMLDVGQGDSFLIKLRHNKGNILIDSFGDNINEIKSLGINKIDTLIITHPDNDHMETASDIIKYFDCQTLVTSYYEKDEKIINLRKMVSNSIEVKEDKILTLNDLQFTFLAPRIYSSDSNSNSLVFKTTINNTSFLFTGDMTFEEEQSILAYKDKIKVDILKVPHHGASTGLSDIFLEHLNFEVALISVGLNNFYGHPDSVTLKKLASKTIYRTDLDGTVLISINKKGYKVKTNLTLNPLIKYYKFIEFN